MKQLFFGYPSRPPAVREANERAARTILDSGLVEGRTWESLKIAGRFVIDEVVDAIRSADLCVFDVTQPNQNVMFELGFAIGADKPVWLVRDPSWEEADSAFQAIRVLTTVGYRTYASSEDIQAAYFSDVPHESAEPIFSDQIQPTLLPGQAPNLFHLMSPQQDDAARAVSRAIDRIAKNGYEIISADPEESTSSSLSWYAQQIHASRAMVIHFGSEGRRGSELTNARYALIAGLAHGMGKDILMLAASDYSSPIDYRDMLHVYTSSQDARSSVEAWTSQRLPDQDRADRAARISLATELKSLRLGEHIAENEVATLENYFVETPGFRHVLADATTIFVGRKGTGKTANFFEAAAQLGEDARVLTVVVKPHSYELEGLVRLMRRYSERDSREFLAESIWRLLLYTTIASAAAEEIAARRVPPQSGSPEMELLTFTEEAVDLFQTDFALRIESVVDALTLDERDESIRRDRRQVGEALHEDLLPYLRQLLGKVLKDRDRVAVLVDNLDKAWGHSADLDPLSHFLIGLLSSARRVSQEFAKQDGWRDALNVTLGVFIREDIFRRVQALAREPDKLPVAHLRWDDPEMLLRVLDARYEAARDTAPEDGELWAKYFDDKTRGVKTSHYMVSRVLPRPRDLVYFANAAIETAIGRGHGRVTEDDVMKAEESYSQFAFEALQVENGLSAPGLYDVFYEFAGGPSVLEQQDLLTAIERSGVDAQDSGATLQRLLELSFLGMETRDGEFEYYELSSDPERTRVLARKFAEANGAEMRYAVHPAFRAYLEVIEQFDQ